VFSWVRVGSVEALKSVFPRQETRSFTAEIQLCLKPGPLCSAQNLDADACHLPCRTAMQYSEGEFELRKAQSVYSAIFDPGNGDIDPK
jgi:hypothetical protein